LVGIAQPAQQERRKLETAGGTDRKIRTGGYAARTRNHFAYPFCFFGIRAVGFQQTKDYFFSGGNGLKNVERVHIAKLEGQIVGLNGRYRENLRHKGVDRTLGIPARHDVGAG